MAKRRDFSWLSIVVVWVALMSGALSLVREFAATFYPAKVPGSQLFRLCSWMAFVISAGWAWWIEHKKFEMEKNRNQKPELTGEIVKAYIGETSMLTADDGPSDGSVVLLDVNAWNQIQMPEVTVHKYELSVTIVEVSGLRLFTGTQVGWTVLLYAGSIRSIDIAAEALRPLRYMSAHSVPDHVGFFVGGLPPNTESASVIELTLIDHSGGRHIIREENVNFVHQLTGLPKVS